MKAERFVRALAGLLLLSGACGPAEVPLIEDPNTFAGMNRVKIEASCRKTTECTSMQAQFDACVANTAEVLENDATKRLNFLTNLARCSAFERCDFVNCANMAAPVYGESQRAKINYTCQQHWGCEMLGGRAPANVAQAVDYCTAEGVGLLDSFGQARRDGFQQAFTTCQAMTTCEFVSCFKY